MARRVVFAGIVLVALIGAATATAVRLRVGDFILAADGSFTPAALPKHHDAPIVDVPTIAGGAGVLVFGSLRIDKRWTSKGKRFSFVNARCELGHLQVWGEFSFTDGDFVEGGLVKSCGVRR